jgi:hypothetical protein
MMSDKLKSIAAMLEGSIAHVYVEGASNSDKFASIIDHVTSEEWAPLNVFVEQAVLGKNNFTIAIVISGKYNFTIDIVYDGSKSRKTSILCTGRSGTDCDGKYEDTVGWDLKHIFYNNGDALKSFLRETFSNIRRLYFRR